MKKHKRTYREFFDLAPDEYVPCEHCWKRRAVDVHHAARRGMGGDQTGEKDTITNLGGVCRTCHDLLDTNPEANEEFKLWLVQLGSRLRKMKRMMR